MTPNPQPGEGRAGKLGRTTSDLMVGGWCERGREGGAGVLVRFL